MEPARTIHNGHPASDIAGIETPCAIGGHAAALMLYARVAGLPSDYVELYLSDFVDLYAAEMDRIPQASRRTPDFRTGCEVMRHAVFAVEEPRLQGHFACLLAAASDARRGADVHPAFASILSALASGEADLLLAMSAASARPSSSQADTPASALCNLRRLGLVEPASSGAEGAPALSALGRRFVAACLEPAIPQA